MINRLYHKASPHALLLLSNRGERRGKLLSSLGMLSSMKPAEEARAINPFFTDERIRSKTESATIIGVIVSIDIFDKMYIFTVQ